MPGSEDDQVGRTSFDHFPAGSLAFLRGLLANNRKDWFEANRDTYETAIKAPAEAFAAVMVERLAGLAGHRLRPRIFRIHRDVRFSRDKSPYNPYLHIAFLSAGTEAHPPGWMFGVEPDRLSLGVGVFAFEADQLEHYRDRVRGPDGTALDALLQDLRRTGIRIADPELKRPPRDRDPASAPGDLLLRKGLTAWIEHDNPDDIVRAGLVDRCMAGFERLAPLYRWLIEGHASFVTIEHPAQNRDA